MTLHEQKQHRLGLILVAFAALAWSSGGIFVRLIPSDLMTLLFWRGVFSGSGVMLFFFVSEGSKALTLQLPFLQVSDSMGNHDSEIVDARSVD